MSLTKITPSLFDSNTAAFSFTNAVSFSNTMSVTGTATFGSVLTANGSLGTSGQVLTSGGSSSNAYWTTPNTSFATAGDAMIMAMIFGG